MEGIPATNRWPRWATNILWATGALVVLTVGFLLRDVPQGIASVLSFVDANADATAAFALLLQAVVFIVTALYARRQLYETRAISARTNTLQLIFEEHRDSTVANHRAIYRDVRDDERERIESYFDAKEYKKKTRDDWEAKRASGEIKIRGFRRAKNKPSAMHKIVEREWRKYWRPKVKLWTERRKAVTAVLNRYEAFAIGVEKGAVDEEMYKRWWKTTLIEDWYVFRPLIIRLQDRNPRAYIEFQSLAEKWQKEATKELQDTKRGRSTW